MKHFYIILVLSLIAGCGGEPVPPGFPTKLVPVTVTLLNKGQAVDRAAVSLIPESPERFIVSAVTDTAGVAVLETAQNTYTKKGVPAGTYKVMLAKLISDMPPPDNLTDAQVDKLSSTELEARAERIRKAEEEMKKKSGLLPEWDNVEKTPFKLTVPAGGKTFTIEISDEKTFVQ